MKISLPYNKNRRYLTGIDWLLGAMSHATRKSYGIGGFSQAILDLEGFLPDEPLKSVLTKISNQFPLLHAKTARDFVNLAPYWKPPRRSKNLELKLRVVDLTDDTSEELFNDHVNTPFESESQHLRFLLIRINQEKSRLGMMFDHRLFDAFAAETFFRLIDQTAQGQLETIAPQIKQTEPAHLDNWKRRFQSGKTVNRLIFKLNEQAVSGLKLPPPGQHPIRFIHEKLTAEQSAAFNRKAAQEIGMPILLPSATARAVIAMHNEFPTTPLPGQQFLVFTSANMRSAGQEWATFLSNQFSLMPLSVPTDTITTTQQVAINLRDQLFDRMKENIPFATHDAAMLGRIFPHWLNQHFLRFVAKGRMCSFYFACLRESGFTNETFLNLPTINLIHTPLVFSPPALNICMTTFHSSFNIVLSYLDGAIPQDAAHRILQAFKSSLLEQ